MPGAKFPFSDTFLLEQASSSKEVVLNASAYAFDAYEGVLELPVAGTDIVLTEDQARHGVIIVTGTGPTNLTIPDTLQKRISFRNSTDVNHTVTIQYGSDPQLTLNEGDWVTAWPGGHQIFTTGAGNTPSDTVQPLADTNIPGDSSQYSRGNHRHKRDVNVAKNGANVGTRHRLNILAGDAITVQDDSAGDQVTVDLRNLGGGGSGLTASDTVAPLGDAGIAGDSENYSRGNHEHKRDVKIAKEGSDVAVRAKINFTGAGVTVADDQGGDQVTVSIPGPSPGGGGGGSSPSPSDSVAPLDGTAAAGDSTLYSRGNHRHFDRNRPTDSQKDALNGTSGAPSLTNEYVTNNDLRNTNARVPLPHNSTHLPNGTDAIPTATAVGLADVNSVGDGNALARANHGHKRDVKINQGGSLVAIRNALNFAGSGVTVTDDQAHDQVTVTIVGGSGGGSNLIVQDHGTSLPIRGIVDFEGSGVTLQDDSGSGRTQITIPAADLTGVLVKTPGTSSRNLVVPTGDFAALLLRAFSSQTLPIFATQNTGGINQFEIGASGDLQLSPANSTPRILSNGYLGQAPRGVNRAQPFTMMGSAFDRFRGGSARYTITATGISGDANVLFTGSYNQAVTVASGATGQVEIDFNPFLNWHAGAPDGYLYGDGYIVVHFYGPGFVAQNVTAEFYRLVSGVDQYTTVFNTTSNTQSPLIIPIVGAGYTKKVRLTFSHPSNPVSLMSLEYYPSSPDTAFEMTHVPRWDPFDMEVAYRRYSMRDANWAVRTRFEPRAVSTGTNIAYVFDTQNDLTSPGTDKLILVATQGKERFHVLGSGDAWIRGGIRLAPTGDLSSSAFFTRLRSAPSITQNYTLTLPAGYGTSGQVLTSDGTGSLAWTTVSGGGGGGGGSPIDATYILMTPNATLTQAEVLGSQVIMAGLLSQRPAPIAAGPLYWAQDVNGGTLYRYDGGAWQKITPGVTEVVIQPSNSVAPLNGVAAVGTSSQYSKGDHQHFDRNRPTDSQKDALIGTSGAPSSTNPFVLDQDLRNTNARVPLPHNLTHSPNGTDPLATASAVGLANANSAGDANSYAKSNHTHKRDLNVALAGSVVGTRGKINFAGVGLSVADDPVGDQVTVTVGAGATPLRGTLSYTPPALSKGQGDPQFISVPGASVGDFVLVSFSVPLPIGVVFPQPQVSGPGTVMATLMNFSENDVSLANGMLSAIVWKAS